MKMAHRNRHQQARPLHLTHVCDARLMRLKPPDDLPSLAQDADVSIVGAEKQAVGACADAGDVVALEELAGFVVGQRHLRDVEEVKRLPLWAELAFMRVNRRRRSSAIKGEKCMRSEFTAHVPRWPSLSPCQRTMTMAGLRGWSCGRASGDAASGRHSGSSTKTARFEYPSDKAQRSIMSLSLGSNGFLVILDQLSKLILWLQSPECTRSFV